MITAKVTVKDRGFKKLQRNLKATGKRIVRVGIFGENASEKHANSAKSNVEIAGFQEFGTGTIPKRSFLRATVDAEEGNIKKLERAMVQGIIKLRTTEARGLELIGVFVVGAIQKRIQGGIDPKLKPATERRKGSTKQLIDTGQLFQSITFAVERRKLLTA